MSKSSIDKTSTKGFRIKIESVISYNPKKRLSLVFITKTKWLLKRRYIYH